METALQEMPDLLRAARGIPLRNRDGSIRAFAMVDAADFWDVSGYCWSQEWNGYARRRGPGNKAIKLHRQIMGLKHGDGLTVDHINRDRLDNRRRNLRVLTQAENRQNTGGWVQRRTAKHSKYRGVYWATDRKKWLAKAVLNGEQHNIGRFDTEQGAADAVAAWRRQHMPYSID